MFADFKTADTDEQEAGITFNTVDKLVTILSSADNTTVVGAVKTAKAHGKSVLVDTISMKNRVQHAQKMMKLGVEFVELHAGLNEQAQPGYSIQVLIDGPK